MKRALAGMILGIMLLCGVFGQAQQTIATNTNAVVPPLVNFSGTLTEPNGKPLTGTVAVTFSLYAEQTGGAALWMETQSLQPDVHGHYTVMLGSTSSDGLPADIFVAGQAHWLGVQVQGQDEQPRVLLVSAPYALKAGDAQTLGGLPVSAFVLVAPASNSNAETGAPASSAATANASAPPPSSSDVTTTGGTANTIPMFTTSTNIQNSIVTQTGTTAVNIAGKLNLPATGVATSSAGSNSRPLDFVASAYNSSTSAAVNQTFQWQAQPVGNDTSTPSGSLNLLYGSGTSTPAQTGLHIASNGQITFATGQKFPGVGTITGITTASGSGLSGGGTSGTLSLSIPSAGVTNAMLADSSITLNANSAGGLTTPGAMALGSTNTIGLRPCSANQVLEYSGTAWNCSSAGTGTITGVTAGSDLTGGGTTGSVTLNLDTTKVPLLASANTFTAEQTINSGGTTPSLSINNTSGAAGIYSVALGAGVAGWTTTSTSNGGVQGMDGSSTGTGGGVYGYSPSGYGVKGVSPGGYGVVGSATTGAAVFGSGTSGTGVLGTATSGYGVYGSSTSGGVGVWGTVPSGGTAVWGTSTGSNYGVGVWGESQGTAFGSGAGSDGVHGVAHSTAGSGVAGINTAQDATGVFGSDTQGYGFVTDSHVSQGRGMGGWVKAMAYVQYVASTGMTVTRCFNSQISGSTASTVPCGITVTYSSGNVWIVDFGFQVDDRFVVVSPIAVVNGAGYALDTDGAPVTSTQVWVNEANDGGVSFYVFVY